MVNYLIPYIDPKKNDGEEDPLFREFTYGDKGNRGEKLKSVKKGDYLFFHTSKNHKRYITAFYEVEEVMPIAKAKNDPLIKKKYQNPHLLHKNEEPHELLVFGHPIKSFVLVNPLELNAELLDQLKIPFNPYTNPTVFGSLTSKLRNWYELSNDQVDLLKKIIFQIPQERFSNPEKLLSSDEIPMLLERDIEELIAYNPTLIGPDLVVKDRQYIFKKSGKRLDLLLENTKTGELTIVEIKKDAIDPKVISQLKDYIEEYKKEENISHINGVIIGKGILPHFEEQILQKIDKYQWKLFNYGWRFSLESPYALSSSNTLSTSDPKLQLTFGEVSEEANSSEKYQLRLVNHSIEDMKHVSFTYSESKNSENSAISTTDRNFDEVKSGEWVIADTFSLDVLEKVSEYEISYITSSSIQTVKFSNAHLQNTSPLEWKLKQIEKISTPTEQILNFIFQHVYEIEVPINNEQYRNLVKKQGKLEEVFREFYQLVNEYYRGQLSQLNIRTEIAIYLEEHYKVPFEQSEGTEIILSCCAACVTYFGLTIEQMAAVLIRKP